MGCSGEKPTGKSAKKDPEPKKPSKPQNINIVDGTTDYFGTTGNKLWTISWKTGHASINPSDPQADTSGILDDVSGVIFQKAVESSQFRADHGVGNKKSKMLKLTDSVVIRSHDPQLTLDCEQVDYSGNEEIVRAQKNVRVLGTIETVGTIEEVWASPDLKTIATPDMFPIHARQQATALALAASLASAQVWTDHKGLTFSAKSWSYDQTQTKQVHYRFKTNVNIDSKSEGLNIRSDQMELDAVMQGNTKAYSVAHATATGNVKIVKTAVSTKGIQTTEISGPKGEYIAGTSESTVKMIGATTIRSIDPSVRQTMTATGSSGVAYLEPKENVTSGNGLRRATLSGPTKVVFVQETTKEERGSTITGTASQMLLENNGSERKITLIGNVHVVGPDSDEVSHVNRAVFVKDAKGYWHVQAGQ